MGKAKLAGLGFVLLALFFLGLNFKSILKLTPEEKINSAIPVSDALTNAQAGVFERVTDSKRKSLERELAARLKLRALNCAKGYSPSWFAGKEEIRKSLPDRSCFTNTDKETAKWLGIVRAGSTLAEPPLRPIPAEAPEFIVADGIIQNVRFATKAGVALIETHQSTEIVDFGSNRPIYSEAKESSMLGTLSPNGRLFTVSDGNKLRIRESESGDVVAEIPSARANQFFWVDEQTAFYSRADTSMVYLIDFSTGKEIPVDAAGRGVQFVAKAPAEKNQYVLFSYQAVTKIGLDRNKAEPEIKLLDEKPVKGVSWWNGYVSSNLTADGTKVFSVSPNLILVALDSLETEIVPLDPFYINACNATPDPDKLLLFGYTRTAMGQRGKNYLYSISKQTMIPVEDTTGSLPRYVYIPSIRKQAHISNNKIAMIDEIPVSEAIPLEQFVADALQEVNQSKLDAFDRQQALMKQQELMQLQAARYRSGTSSYRSPAWAPEAAAPIPAPAFGPASSSPGRSMAGTSSLIAGLARNAQIESIGVYQGPRGGAGTAEGRNMGTVQVSVRRSAKPIVLVLSSYEPVRWNLMLESGARLSAVLVSGYHPSQVIGAGSARTLMIGSSYAYKPGSVEYQRLNQEVARLTGKNIEVFQGRYEGSSFSIGG